MHGGGRVTDGVPAGGYYVRPALVEIAPDAPIIQQETFAPILYLMRYRELDEAIRMHNGVPQGLASAILTRDVREAERFTSPAGSDCGIVEREHRHERRGDRRRVRRRKGNRRRPRIGQRLLEGLHAPRDQHRQLFRRAAAGAGDQVRRVANLIALALRRSIGDVTAFLASTLETISGAADFRGPLRDPWPLCSR